MRYRISKIVVIGFLINLLIISFSTIAFAEQPLKTYVVDEIPLEITLPEKLITFSKTVDENDPNLKRLNLTKESLDKRYTDSNIYLNAISPNSAFEIILSINQNSNTERIYHLNTLSQSKIKYLKKSFLENDSYESCDEFEFNNIKFIKVIFTVNDNHLLTKYLDYYTIINGKELNISFHSCNDVITEEQSDFFESVVKNINFTNIKEKPSNKSTSTIWLISIISLTTVLGVIFIYLKFFKVHHNNHQIVAKETLNNNSMFKSVHPQESEDNYIPKIVDNTEEKKHFLDSKEHIQSPSKKDICINIHYYDN